VPAPPPPDAASGAHLLARVLRHELFGALRIQEQVLSRAARSLPGDPLLVPDLDLAHALAQEMLGVLDVLAVLAAPTRAPVPVRLGEVLGPLLRHHEVAALCSRRAQDAVVDGGPAPALLRNLLANATEHAPPGSVRLTVRRHGPRVCVRLHQDGPRPPEVVQALRRRQPPPGRRGLGLWLVRLLCDQHGATLRTGLGPGPSWTTTLELPVVHRRPLVAQHGGHQRHAEDDGEREDRAG
jgi:signal transduction histidine kinase